MNICHSDTNTTLNDSLTTSSSAGKIRLILGLAVIATNITLVFGFTKKKQFTKTTFIFFSNLGTSDISFGFFMALGGIVMATSRNHTQIIVQCTMPRECSRRSNVCNHEFNMYTSNLNSSEYKNLFSVQWNRMKATGKCNSTTVTKMSYWESDLGIVLRLDAPVIVYREIWMSYLSIEIEEITQGPHKPYVLDDSISKMCFCLQNQLRR